MLSTFYFSLFGFSWLVWWRRQAPCHLRNSPRAFMLELLHFKTVVKGTTYSKLILHESSYMIVMALVMLLYFILVARRLWSVLMFQASSLHLLTPRYQPRCRWKKKVDREAWWQLLRNVECWVGARMWRLQRSDASRASKVWLIAFTFSCDYRASSIYSMKVLLWFHRNLG